jgi:protein-disulfide isomerase
MDACFADQELADRILQTRLEAQNQHDISSTPSFVIDGKTYPGSRDIEEFGELLDPLLDES